MSITISIKTTASDIKYIYETSQNIIALTPRPFKKLTQLSKSNLIATARDNKKIIGWVISEPLSKNVFELGLGFVAKPYRGQGILYQMLRPLTGNQNASYIFATYEPRIIQQMHAELNFHPATLKELTIISRGKFILKRLSNPTATQRVASHLKAKKALYGIRRANQS